jgi:hypothetical protein
MQDRAAYLTAILDSVPVVTDPVGGSRAGRQSGHKAVGQYGNRAMIGVQEPRLHRMNLSSIRTRSGLRSRVPSSVSGPRLADAEGRIYGFVSCTPYSSKMKPSRGGRPLARPNQYDTMKAPMLWAREPATGLSPSERGSGPVPGRKRRSLTKDPGRRIGGAPLWHASPPERPDRSWPSLRRDRYYLTKIDSTFLIGLLSTLGLL